MLTLNCQLSINCAWILKFILTGFVQISRLNLCLTLWSRSHRLSYRLCYPLKKPKDFNAQLKFLLAYVLHSWQLGDCYRISMSTRIRTSLFFFIFIFFTLAESRQLLIKIALYLELFRFLQFVVKLDKISLCSSSPHISSRREFTALAHHGLFARPGDQIYQAAQITSSSSLSQFAALGETFVGFHTTASSLRGRR